MLYLPVDEKEPVESELTLSVDKRVIPLHYKSLHSWPSKMFGFPHLCAIDTIGDGSCFFHAVVSAFYPLYYFTNSLQTRSKLVQQFRRELASVLGSPAPDHVVEYCRLHSARDAASIDVTNNNNRGTLRYYDVLSRGTLKQLAESVPEFGLEQMQRILMSNEAVDLSYLEFISLFLNKNIFFLSKGHQDVYSTGDRELLESRDRQCIVIMADGSHYELVGVHNKSLGVVQTIFAYTDELITCIRDRLDVLTKAPKT